MIRDVAPGALSLSFAEWIPGEHAPTGHIDKLAGLRFSAGNQPIPWTRDPLDVFRFNLVMPPGGSELEIETTYLSPYVASQHQPIRMSDTIVLFRWNTLLLYPSDLDVDDLWVEAGITLPAGWELATPLDTVRREGDRITFAQAPLRTMVDSPILAGRHLVGLPLGSIGGAEVRLNVAADLRSELPVKAEHLDPHKALVHQAEHLFRSRHFRRYEFLLAVTDDLTRDGVEHQESSENVLPAGYFSDWANAAPQRYMLAHEFVHSWNGKFRRPTGHMTRNFAGPFNNELLWLYEGLTEYLGYVLNARAGIWSPEMTIQYIGLAAAFLEHERGRTWRPVQDTINDAVISQRRVQPWESYQRPERYYLEGAMVWLDADTLIRERSGGTKSLDDFVAGFFGVEDGSVDPLPYDAADIVEGLARACPHDWKRFFAERLSATPSQHLFDGMARGGYRVAYGPERTDMLRQRETLGKYINLEYSIGLRINGDGTVARLNWESSAFKAGLTPASKIIAVNGRSFTFDRMNAAVAAADGPYGRIDLIVETGPAVEVVVIPHQAGHRFPKAVPIAGADPRLDHILAARG